MTDRYAVIGHPVAHSKSPRIHAAFAAATGQDLRYETLLAPLDGFVESWRRFVAEGGRGANVTVPFKEEAWALCDVRSPRAALAGAVNTLMPGKDGRLYGDNTDGIGLVRDLRDNAGWTLAGARVLVLGAGGASRGVILPLLEAGVASITIANRTMSKAIDLAALFATHGQVKGVSLAELSSAGTFDLLINATSASLLGEALALPASLHRADTAVYDMMYGRDTPFLRWAADAGLVRRRDGLGMLVEQAAEAFFLWRQVRPETATLLAALRAELS